MVAKADEISARTLFDASKMKIGLEICNCLTRILPISHRLGAGLSNNSEPV